MRPCCAKPIADARRRPGIGDGTDRRTGRSVRSSVGGGQAFRPCRRIPRYGIHPMRWLPPDRLGTTTIQVLSPRWTAHRTCLPQREKRAPTTARGLAEQFARTRSKHFCNHRGTLPRPILGTRVHLRGNAFLRCRGQRSSELDTPISGRAGRSRARRIGGRRGSSWREPAPLPVTHQHPPPRRSGGAASTGHRPAGPAAAPSLRGARGDAASPHLHDRSKRLRKN